MLRVFWTELREHERAAGDEIPLSVYREEKLRTVKAPRIRRQMLATEGLLIHAVRGLYPGTPLPLAIGTQQTGKPYFTELPLCFSLSHSGPFVACAIADHEIGIDVQERRSVYPALVSRFFSEAESRFVWESTDKDAAFTAIWCLKESYLKATGEGITRPLAGFSVLTEHGFGLADRPQARFWQKQDERFHLAVCSLDGMDVEPYAEYVCQQS